VEAVALITQTWEELENRYRSKLETTP
jgi:hypothetical protein